MAESKETQRERVLTHAFRQVSPSKLSATNLYVDSAVREKGQAIGPAFQGIIADRPTILVFVDDNPLANFGHPCRYFLYDASNGEPYREAPARFPPYTGPKPPETLKPFYEPIHVNPSATAFPVRPIPRCPIIFPDGTRYAVLFSGMSNTRHLNDLEFLYRTLIDLYGFDKNNIYALSYDGTTNTQEGANVTWPGDGTPYRINVTGQGTRADFEAAIDDLKTRIRPDDVLLIHTNNHGDNDGPGLSFLCYYPSFQNKYYVADFTNKLAELPQFRELIVMMEQCCSGGFDTQVIAKSSAGATSIAAAATETQLSWASPDGHWDSFARDWISAQAGHDPYGAALVSNPDTDGDGKIEAEEAFAYALSIQNPSDSPNYDESSEAGGDIALGQEYIVWWWWCYIWEEVLEQYYDALPLPEYYQKLRRLQPDLVELTATLDAKSDALRRSTAAEIARLAAAAFR